MCGELAVAEGLCAACALRAIRAARRQDARRVPPVRPGALEEKLLLPAEVAVHLRIDRSSVYRLVHEGKLRAVKIGRRIKVRSSSLARYIGTNPVRRVADY